MSSPELPLMLTADAVADLLSISLRTVWRMVRNGELPQPVRYNRKLVRWKSEDIREWMAQQRASVRASIVGQGELLTQKTERGSLMKVYVASSWRNRYQPGVIEALRGAGLEVYDFRNPGAGLTGFNWREIDPDWLKWTPRDWRAALSHPVAQRGYALDRGGMDTSDCCVLVLPSGRSAHLEAGFMAAQGKPVLTYAPEPVEPDLMNLLLGPPEHICLTLDELLWRLVSSSRSVSRLIESRAINAIDED